jgi:hypothetical protein
VIPATFEELMADRAERSRLADLRVEALRLASTLGEARAFHEREARRGISRYERALSDYEGDESPAQG